MFPGSPAPVLAWLAECEPDSLERAATAGYCKDVVMQRLTGVRATDASDASLPFLDPHTRCYHPEALALCGLAGHCHLLAPVTGPLPAGGLTRDAADLLGLPAGTPVAAGPFDMPAGALGSGVDTAGDGHLILGTTLACQVLTSGVDTGGEPAGMTLTVGMPGRWLRAMPAMTGCAGVDWLMELLGHGPDGLDGLLAGSPPGARGVTCLPYFSPAGERAPFLEPHARAAFSGITVQTSKQDLVRAGCEAVAYAARHCFEAAGLTGEVAACGGGTGSEAWLGIIADVLGRPVRLAPQPETGARGAVLAALRALGREVDTTAWTAPVRVAEPDPDRADFYAEGYAGYRARVDAARAEWGGLGVAG
jgi:sugar (pentulose or hexulose) kinase